MHNTPLSCAVFLLSATIAIGCGSVTPTAPDPVVPPTSIANLLGHWSGSGSLYYTNAQGLNDGYSCTRSVSIRRQQGGQFSGSVAWDGVGPESDKNCYYGSTFSGTIAADGTFTMRMDQPFASSFYCTRLSGEDVYTGRLTAASELEGQMTDRVSCVTMSGLQTFEADRTIRFSVRQVCAPPDPRCPVDN